MPNSVSFYAPESLSLIGALTVAVIALWRALQAKDRECARLIKETVQQTDMLASLARVVDRLRTEGFARSSPSSVARYQDPTPRSTE